MQNKFKDGSVMACGTATNDAELRYVGAKNSALATFSLAVGKNQDTTTIYVNCKAWRRLGEYAAGIRKGDAVCVVGRIEENVHNGNTYKNLVADWLNYPGAAAAVAIQPEIPSTEGFQETGDDGDLPF